MITAGPGASAANAARGRHRSQGPIEPRARGSRPPATSDLCYTRAVYARARARSSRGPRARRRRPPTRPQATSDLLPARAAGPGASAADAARGRHRSQGPCNRGPGGVGRRRSRRRRSQGPASRGPRSRRHRPPKQPTAASEPGPARAAGPKASAADSAYGDVGSMDSSRLRPGGVGCRRSQRRRTNGPLEPPARRRRPPTPA